MISRNKTTGPGRAVLPGEDSPKAQILRVFGWNSGYTSRQFKAAGLNYLSASSNCSHYLKSKAR